MTVWGGSLENGEMEEGEPFAKLREQGGIEGGLVEGENERSSRKRMDG